MSDGPGDWQQYVRWRPRMVRQSVYEDLVTTLEGLGWYSRDPNNPALNINLLEGEPLKLRETFPDESEYQDRSVESNTLAMDHGTPSEEYEYEMGGMAAQDWTFTFAFYAVSDAAAQALLQDMADRYWGRTEDPFISLFNYADATPSEVLRMEVDAFRFNRSVDQIYPGHDLWFAEMVVTDFISQRRI